MTEQHYAGFWKRVLAALIDTLILWIPCSVFQWTLGDRFTPETYAVIDFIQITCIWAVYYGLLESSPKAATLGKQIVGLRVCDFNGNPLSFTRAATRFLMGIIASLPLGIGIFMVGWTEKKQGLHDMICKCLVIRSSAS